MREDYCKTIRAESLQCSLCFYKVAVRVFPFWLKLPPFLSESLHEATVFFSAILFLFRLMFMLRSSSCICRPVLLWQKICRGSLLSGVTRAKCLCLCFYECSIRRAPAEITIVNDTEIVFDKLHKRLSLNSSFK